MPNLMPLPPAIDAELRSLRDASGGALSYYADDRAGGTPLVLLHSVNAAASAYEVRPLFDRYRAERAVYALDLPGFGFSERGDRAYTPALYTGAIEALLRAVTAGGAACDVLALSLTGEFAAAAAVQTAAPVRSLALVSPTGLWSEPSASMQRAGNGDGGPSLVQRILGAPLVGAPLFDLLVTRPSIRYFLEKSFAGPMDEGVFEYAYLTSHQPGARFAPLTFVSGRLFTPDVRERWYERVPVPTLVMHDDAPYVSFGALPALIARNPRWKAERIGPTRGLPQWERLDVMARLLEKFWAQAR